MGDLFNSGFHRNGPRDRVGIEVVRLERFPATLAITVDFGGQCHHAAGDVPIVLAFRFRHLDELTEC
ncbi:hypothetical protein CA13_20630 [Planctomycetes bacterium CA13]|uniref:Uncharacterized protein n=1 Tax=Novipirellula herctigrandis TaxID=2527986 RepID=A0A5C5YZS4_9BACT|nr:hypothetical protein CA13_20630 [Planctomycetes bacterium CA13]